MHSWDTHTHRHRLQTQLARRSRSVSICTVGVKLSFSLILSFFHSINLLASDCTRAAVGANVTVVEGTACKCRYIAAGRTRVCADRPPPQLESTVDSSTSLNQVQSGQNAVKPTASPLALELAKNDNSLTDEIRERYAPPRPLPPTAEVVVVAVVVVATQRQCLWAPLAKHRN